MTSLAYLEGSSTSDPSEDTLIFSSSDRYEAKGTMEYYNIAGVYSGEIEPEVEGNNETFMTDVEDQNTQLKSLSSEQIKWENKKHQPENNYTIVENHKSPNEDQKMEKLEERWEKIDHERLETINRQGEEIKELKTKLTQLHERCVAVENIVKLYLKTEDCTSQTGRKENSLETRLAALEMALGKAVNYMYPRMDEVLSKIEEASGGSFCSFPTTYPPQNRTTDSISKGKSDGSNSSKENQTEQARVVHSHSISSQSKATTSSILFTPTSVSYSEPSITFEVADDSLPMSRSVFAPTLNLEGFKQTENVSKSSQSELQSILLDPKVLDATQKNVGKVYPSPVHSDVFQQSSTTASSSRSSLPSESYDTHTSDDDWNGSDIDMYPYSISTEYPLSPRLTSSLTAISTTPPPPTTPRPLPADLDSALRDAAKEGNADEICRLLLAGADANAGDNLQTTALHWAAIKGHLQAASALLEGDASVDCRDVSRWTPLHFAASKGHTSVLAFLLRRGATVASKDDKHWTPLHVAVHGGHVDCVRMLLDAGADAFAADVMGKKMLDLSDSQAVRHILLGYME